MKSEPLGGLLQREEADTAASDFVPTLLQASKENKTTLRQPGAIGVHV